jgi:hypothetical protein
MSEKHDNDRKHDWEAKTRARNYDGEANDKLETTTAKQATNHYDEIVDSNDILKKH